MNITLSFLDYQGLIMIYPNIYWIMIMIGISWFFMIGYIIYYHILSLIIMVYCNDWISMRIALGKKVGHRSILNRHLGDWVEHNASTRSVSWMPSKKIAFE